MSSIAGSGGRPIEAMPDELFSIVLGFLGTKDLVQAGRVCRKWHDLSKSTADLRLRLNFARFVYSIPLESYPPKKGFLLECDIAESFNHRQIPRLLNELDYLHKTWIAGLMWEIDSRRYQIELEQEDAGPDSDPISENELGELEGCIKRLEEKWEDANVLRNQICLALRSLMELARFDLIRKLLSEFDVSNLTIHDKCDTSDFSDGFLDKDIEFIECLATAALRAHCPPDKITDICYLGINLEADTLFFLSEHFSDLINYPDFSDLFTSLFELANEFEADDDVEPDLEGEERLDFFNLIRLNLHFARFTQLYQDGHVEEAETLIDRIINWLPLTDQEGCLEFFKKLYQIEAFDHLERLVAEVNPDDDFPSIFISQNIQIQQLHKVNKPLSLERLRHLLAPLAIKTHYELLLHCLEQNIQVEEATALLDEMIARIPPSYLTKYATWIMKEDQDKGVALAKMAISNITEMLDTQINLSQALVVAVEIALALRNSCPDEAEVLFLRAFAERGEVQTHNAHFTDLVIQYRIASKRFDEGQAFALSIEVYFNEERIDPLSTILESYHSYLREND